MNDIKREEVAWDFLKIVDFYTLFPHLITSMKFSRDILQYKKTLAKIRPPYENLPPPTRLMFELGEIQEQTIKSLVAKGIVKKESFASGKVRIRFEMLPKRIQELIENEPFRQQDWYQFLTCALISLPLKGKDGLKDRSGLMEYRYDHV